MDWWKREHVRVFTDASGEDRCIAAVIVVGGVWKYTWMKVPDRIWESLLPRQDNQIGVTEAMAVALALETFKPELEGNLVSCFVDNQGTMHGFIKGRSQSTEQNLIISEAWMEMARQRISITFWRVASKCNCSDGPSRLDFALMKKKGAHLVQPVLPQYLYQLWEVSTTPKL